MAVCRKDIFRIWSKHVGGILFQQVDCFLKWRQNKTKIFTENKIVKLKRKTNFQSFFFVDVMMYSTADIQFRLNKWLGKNWETKKKLFCDVHVPWEWIKSQIRFLLFAFFFFFWKQNESKKQNQNEKSELRLKGFRLTFFFFSFENKMYKIR